MRFPFKSIDLTHTLSQNAPSWNGSCGFENEIKLDYSECETEVKFRVQQVKMHAGIGTHMDAPSHCISGGLNINELPLEQLIVPCYMMDVEAKVAVSGKEVVSGKANQNYLFSLEDLHEFEAKYGQIAAGSFVIIHTGWDRFWNDPKQYRGNLVFPSVSKEAANLLLERNIAGLGIDTLSPDLPNSGFPVHKALLGAGKYIVENVANAQKMSATGMFSLALPIKIQDGTEAAIRLIALYS